MTAFDALFRTRLEDYGPAFEKFFKLRLDHGILEVRMHTDDGPLRWGGGPHRMLIPLFQAIDHDEDVEVVILTGTGDSFNAALDTAEYLGRGMLGRWDGESTGYDLTYRDQTREPLALLGLHVPVISAINGPVGTHAELALLNDIVLCTDTTTFSDGHWPLLGIVPGDGVHTVFRELLGHNRARYFLYSGRQIGAEEALRLGLVGEVVAPGELLDRAWTIAAELFMTKSRVQRRLARATLIQPWRELFVKELAFGMAHECLGAAIGPALPLTGALAEVFGSDDGAPAPGA